MPFGKVVELLEDARSAQVFDINICGGEPFLHEDVMRVVATASRSGFGLSINTNGVLIDRDAARELSEYDVIKNTQVSFDSHLATIHNSTRGAFASAYAGFLALVEQAGRRDLAPSVGIVLNRLNVDSVDDTVMYFSQHTSRFHLMNLMNCSPLACTRQQRRVFNEVMLPRLLDISRDRGLQISSVTKRDLGAHKSRFGEAHIDCLAGYTSLVVASDFTVYPCDVAPFPLGVWSTRGDLMRIYERSRSLWAARQRPWCYDFVDGSANVPPGDCRGSFGGSRCEQEDGQGR